MKVYQHVNIVTCDKNFHVYLDGILAVKDSQIVYVGQEKPEILDQAEQIIDYQGAWIMPGLINCHTHSAMTGYAESEMIAISTNGSMTIFGQQKQDLLPT